MTPRTRKTTPRLNTSDWRNLPYEKWNTRTFTQYFVDMNAEKFGVDGYLPFRNWGAEQRLIKSAIGAHGAELLRLAFDECFRTHRVTREYPILTAGFAVSYLINAIIPRLKEATTGERGHGQTNGGMTAEEVAEWL